MQPLVSIGKFGCGWACLGTPNQNQWTHILPFFDPYLYATNQIDTLLSEILVIKESCNLTGWQQFEPEFSQIWGLHSKTENVLRFRLLSPKSDDKPLWKLKKSILCPFCALFTSNKNVSVKPTSIGFYSVSRFLLMWRILEKN